MIYQSIVDISEDVDVPFEEGLDLLLEYLNKAAKERGLSPVEETLSKDLEAQEDVSTESVKTQIELDSIGNKSADFEGDEKKEAHLEEEEEEEEEVMEETSYVRDEDFFGALESQPKKIEEQDDSLIEHFSNRANASEES
ncbi:hypothetical protein QL285_052219 [Trifolium repens]|nr:hypothetical protein QL285_052219 [Trifolium repens]